MSKKFTDPILQLNDIANKMSKLDFSQKYRITDTENEINELGISINTMSDKLERTIKQLRENNWDTVVFAYGSPLRAESFLRVFEHVMKLNPELKVYYTTTMNNSDFKEVK